jgi:pimeloyl-ACP methyl ester carboxylesterase
MVRKHWLTALFALTLSSAQMLSVGRAFADPPSFHGERHALAVPPGPGPAEYNQVWIRKYGPVDARHVLVLVAGSPSGQGNYTALAPELVERVPGLQVWTVDRRENAFEDITGFLSGDPDAALAYYLLGEEVDGRTFTPVEPEDAPFVREWGIGMLLEDLHAVVQAARDGGNRSVILGGHSMGGIIAPTYAAWDFDGVPGYRDLEALVLIDGVGFGAFEDFVAGTPFAHPWQTVAEAQAALDRLEDESPFGSAGPDSPLPEWLEGVAPELGCLYALVDPQAPSVLQPEFALAYPLPPFPLTNEAFIGFLFKNGLASEALKARLGDLARGGIPRPWVNGYFASVPASCAAFTIEPGNSMEWYYPVRLDMDLLLAVPELRRTEVTDYLDLRPYHLSDIDIPVYGFESGITKGGVLRGVRRLIGSSRITHYVLAGDQAMGHVDPLVDVPERNYFVTTVVPFLRAIVSGRSACTVRSGVAVRSRGASLRASRPADGPLFSECVW